MNYTFKSILNQSSLDIHKDDLKLDGLTHDTLLCHHGSQMEDAIISNDFTFSNKTLALANSLSFTDLTVNGNLTVNGSQTIIDTETVTLEDNLILINKNQTGTPLTTLKSGLEVERGDNTNYQFLFVESDDSFKIGEVGSLQSVATREDTPTDNGIPRWDDTNKIFTTSGTTTDHLTQGTTNKYITVNQANQIATNTASIASGVLSISTFQDSLTTNASGIASNATNIATNKTNIESNDTDIATNKTNIATNKTNIATNTTNIESNDTDIATNATNISTNATAITTNATAITTNATNITNNSNAIASNDTDIATNATNITTNATNITNNSNATQSILNDYGIRIATLETNPQTLTTDEYTQLGNIGNTTISADQWGYLGELNQSLTTTSNVDFNGIYCKEYFIYAKPFLTDWTNTQNASVRVGRRLFLQESRNENPFIGFNTCMTTSSSGVKKYSNYADYNDGFYFQYDGYLALRAKTSNSTQDDATAGISGIMDFYPTGIYSHQPHQFNSTATFTQGISATGDVSATGNISATGDVSATGNISATDVNATGNISATDLNATGDIVFSNDNKEIFVPSGTFQIRQGDDYHRIVFNQSGNAMEFREYGAFKWFGNGVSMTELMTLDYTNGLTLNRPLNGVDITDMSNKVEVLHLNSLWQVPALTLEFRGLVLTCQTYWQKIDPSSWVKYEDTGFQIVNGDIDPVRTGTSIKYLVQWSANLYCNTSQNIYFEIKKYNTNTTTYTSVGCYNATYVTSNISTISNQCIIECDDVNDVFSLHWLGSSASVVYFPSINITATLLGNGP